MLTLNVHDGDAGTSSRIPHMTTPDDCAPLRTPPLRRAIFLAATTTRDPPGVEYS